MKILNKETAKEIVFYLDSDFTSKYANYLAMDADGRWNLFEEEPYIGSLNIWLNQMEGGEFTRYYQLNPSEHPKNFSGDWLESLFKIER